MTAAAALARAEAVGLRLRLSPDGQVQMQAETPPPPDVLADLRRWRGGVAGILASLGARPDLMNQTADAPCTALLPSWLPAPGLARLPSWSEVATIPPPGAWCSCCGRFHRKGGRWWREAEAPRGHCSFATRIATVAHQSGGKDADD